MVRKWLLNGLNLWKWNEKQQPIVEEKERARERSLVCFLKVPLPAGGQNNLNKHVGCERCLLGSHISVRLFFPAAPSAVPTLPDADFSSRSVVKQSSGVCFTDF